MAGTTGLEPAASAVTVSLWVEILEASIQLADGLGVGNRPTPPSESRRGFIIPGHDSSRGQPLTPDCVQARWSQSALSPNSSEREQPDLPSSANACLRRLPQVSRDTADNELSTLSLNSKQRNRTFPTAAASCTRPWLPSGSGCRDRRLSRY